MSLAGGISSDLGIVVRIEKCQAIKRVVALARLRTRPDRDLGVASPELSIAVWMISWRDASSAVSERHELILICYQD